MAKHWLWFGVAVLATSACQSPKEPAPLISGTAPRGAAQEMSAAAGRSASAAGTGGATSSSGTAGITALDAGTLGPVAADGGAAPAGPAAVGGAPAPAADGGSPAAPRPLTLHFEPPGAGFTTSQEVLLRPDDPSAEVHYTLDGSLPSASSPVATAPVQLNKTTLVRAVAVRGGSTGPLANAAYFQLAEDAREVRSDLPVLVVDMQGSTAPDALTDEKVGALLGVFEPQEGTTRLQGAAALTSRIGIKVRGRSSRLAEKHSYTLELWGSQQEDAPASLLGMPADGDWVLYAPYNTDPSLMHNALGYALSQRIGRYAPRTRFCELFLVSQTDKVAHASYAGIYVLTERISRGDERVPINKLKPDELTEPSVTGGYIAQVDSADAPNEAFAAAGLSFVYVYPKADEVQSAQSAYLAKYLDGAMRAVSASDGRDPMTGQHYEQLLDVPSFIDHHILSMLFKNPDAFKLSSYFYKDRGGKLVAGPLWDLDLAMAAKDPFGNRSLDPEHWGPSTSDDAFHRSFWGPLFKHAEFASAYWARWHELLAGSFQAIELRTLVSGFARQLTQAEPRNRARWPASAPRDANYEAETKALSDWLQARVAWISANLDRLP